MKIKLKGKQSMDSAFSYRGFSIENWNKLNSGKTVEVDSIPKHSEDLVEEVKSSNSSPKKNKEGVKNVN